jgi:hypothetical protein
LAVLCDGLQGLPDQVHVALVDVEAQQTQASSGAATHDVQELQRLTHQVVVGLVVLVPQEVLDSGTNQEGGKKWFILIGYLHDILSKCEHI